MRHCDQAGAFHPIALAFPYDPEAAPDLPRSRVSHFHEAEVFAASERASLRVEGRARPDDTGSQSLSQWLKRYEREETPKKKSAGREASTLCRLCELAPDLLRHPADSLRPGDFVGTDLRCLKAIMAEAGYAPATIRRYPPQPPLPCRRRHRRSCRHW